MALKRKAAECWPAAKRLKPNLLDCWRCRTLSTVNEVNKKIHRKCCEFQKCDLINNIDFLCSPTNWILCHYHLGLSSFSLISIETMWEYFLVLFQVRKDLLEYLWFPSRSSHNHLYSIINHPRIASDPSYDILPKRYLLSYGDGKF